MRAFLVPLLFAVATAMAVPASAEDLQFPSRKSGRWDLTMNLGNGIPVMNVSMCVDAATDAAMMAAGLSMTKDACSRQDMTRDGDSLVIDSVCDFGGKTTTAHIIISGDFETAYTVHITGSVEGTSRKTDMTHEARWAGACGDDLKPGEIMMPGGMKFDATRMMNAMGG